MNSFPELLDATAEERADAQWTRELLDAMEPVRPDAEAFAEGVRARIGGASKSEHEQLSPWIRAAASLLPPMALPKSLPAALGATAATKASAKILPTFVLWPVATLVAVVLTLLVVLRAAFAGQSNVAQRQDARLAREEMLSWWSGHMRIQLAGVAVLAAALVLSPMFAFTLTTLGISIGLVALCSRLTKAGLATRDEIARAARGAMIFLGSSFGALPLMQSGSLITHWTGWNEFPAQQGLMFVIPLLLAGAWFCHTRIQERVPMDKFFVPIFALSLIPLGIAVSFQSRSKPLESFEGVDAVVMQERFSPRGDQVALLDAIARHAGLAGIGREALQSWSARMGTQLVDSDYFAFDALGLVEEAQRKAWIAELPRFQEDLEVLAQKPELAKSLSFVSRLMLEADALRADTARRDAYAALVVRAHSEPGQYDSLVTLWWAVHALEVCGADISGLRPRVEELLMSCANVDERGANVGFFTFRKNMQAVTVYPGYSAPEAAAAAVLLMSRFGVPSAIDPAGVERALVRSVHTSGEVNAVSAYMAFATQRAVRGLPGYAAEERGVLRLAAEWQAAFSALVLVFGAVVLTLRAKPA